MPSKRFIHLPREGKLLVCTDIHGNLLDFKRMQAVFDVEREQQPTYLLFTGDLIHGPNLTDTQWPKFLGAPYSDASVEVIEAFWQLRASAPGHVIALLGNHEHSHVGGPHTPKFWPDETAHFEQALGQARTAQLVADLEQWPLMAFTPCGVVVTHAAPNVTLSREQIEWLSEATWRGYEQVHPGMLAEQDILMRLLWSRRCSRKVAHDFLQALGEYFETRFTTVVFGHDVAPKGFSRIGKEQLQLSSSFGVEDKRKYYLEIDLAAHYDSVDAFRVGDTLKRLVR